MIRSLNSCVALICLGSLLSLSTLIAEQSAVTPKDIVWDLSGLFQDNEAWEAALLEVESYPERMAAFAGRLGESPEVLLGALKTREEMIRSYARVGSFASLRADEDTGAEVAQDMRKRAGIRGSRIWESMAFLSPEIAAIGGDTLNRWMEELPELAEYRHFFDEIIRYEPYTLSTEMEALLGASYPPLGASSDTYRTFTNAEMPWPEIVLQDGSEMRLDKQAYVMLRQSPVREDRLAGFQAFWQRWNDFERTLGEMLNGEIKGSFFISKARGFEGTLERELFNDNLPPGVYHGLVEAVNANLSHLHRAMRQRALLLEVEDLGYHDIYADLSGDSPTWDYDQARETLVDALSVLGEEYASLFEEGIYSNWTHLYPGKGKRSGAYMSGWASYDLHPFILMNYQGDFNSVSTLAHEWGHAVHSMLANRYQSWTDSRYDTFVAETAAIANELILQEKLLQQVASEKEELFLLLQILEQYRGTLFRQTKFAEFEAGAHAAYEAGSPWSGAVMSEKYLELVRKYYGEDEGVIQIDPTYGIEWAYIPHFYRNFYVFQYSTSFVAANAFVERILAGEEGSLEDYLGALKAGGSAYPYDILKNAGVDLAQIDPYQASFARMERVMDRIDELMGIDSRR